METSQGLTVATITLSPSVDYTVVLDTLVPEEKLRGQVTQVEPGGGGVQVARGLLRLSSRVEAIVMIGGPTGATLLKLLNREHLTVRAVMVSKDTRPSLTLHVNDANTNYRIVGRSGRLASGEHEPVLTHLREMTPLPPYVVYSGSVPPGVPTDIVYDIAQIVASRGSKLIVDTSGDALRAAIAAKVELIKPSKEELADVVGMDPNAPDFDVRVAARKVLDMGVRIVITSLGGEGVYLASADGLEATLTPPTVPVASTVAAGDSLVAGLVGGLARGLPLLQAARLGVACGTGTVLYPGSGIFTLADISRISPQVKITLHANSGTDAVAPRGTGIEDILAVAAEADAE